MPAGRGFFETSLSMRPGALFSQIPKRSSEPNCREERLGLFDRVSSPFGLEFVLVPTVGQLPALVRCESGTALEVAGPAPAIDVLFGTEEQHGASGKPNIVPPVVGRDGEVDESFTLFQCPACDLQ